MKNLRVRLATRGRVGCVAMITWVVLLGTRLGISVALNTRQKRRREALQTDESY